jgi:hypothetical protein
MTESKNLYELTSKLGQVGYDYLYIDDTNVTLSPSKDYCVNLVVDIEDLGDSVSLIIELIWDDVNIKTKTYPNITVSNATLILTNILENIKKIDTKAHRCLDSFDTIMYPVGVRIEKAVKSIEETLRNCDGRFVGGHLFRIERVGGELEVEVNEETKVVEITLYDGDSYFSIYRREIDVRYIKEMCEEINGVADKFNQSFLTEDEAIETVFKDI